MILSLILGFLLGIGVLVFALQNNQLVTLGFLGYTFTSSLALVILLALTAGVIASLLVSIPSSVRTSLTLRRLRREAADLYAELERTRALGEPLAPAKYHDVGTPVSGMRPASA